MSLMVMVTLLVLAGGSVAAFFKFAPQIGGNPSGDRLELLRQSPNFSEGKFQNSVETNMDMPLKRMLPVFREYFRQNHDRVPVTTITTQPFDGQSFNRIPEAQTAVSWFGHSSALFRIEGKTILADPVFGERASMFSFMGPKRFPYDHHITVEELPAVDIVIISHDHYDHLDYPTMLKLKGRVNQFYVPLGVGEHLESWGIPADQIREFDWWDNIIVSDSLELVFTPSRHFSGRGLTNRFTTLWGSWVLKGSTHRIYFSGDSGYSPDFKKIGEIYGPFDLTLMECGQYNEAWPEIHMMPEETVQAHIDVRGGYLMPIHWGKFELAVHDWKEPVERMVTRAEDSTVKIATPEVGEVLVLQTEITTKKWWENFR